MMLTDDVKNEENAAKVALKEAKTYANALRLQNAKRNTMIERKGFIVLVGDTK